MNKVIVAGSINMDIVSSIKKHPKIGETVFSDDIKYFYWGKGANQAISSARLWGKTTIVGMVWKDDFGKKLIRFLEEQGIENKISTHPKAHTGTALIAVSTQTSDNTIIVLPGANFHLTEDEVSDVVVSKWDVLVCQFEIPLQTIKAFFTRGRKAGTINILNPAPAKEFSKELLDLVDILILNETELEIISKKKVDILDDKSISTAVNKIKNSKQNIIITIGKKWAIAFIDNKIVRVESRKVKAVDTTWAWDCFIGTLAASIANNKSLIEAIKFANIAASICVTKPGAWPSMPTFKEVMKILKHK